MLKFHKLFCYIIMYVNFFTILYISYSIVNKMYVHNNVVDLSNLIVTIPGAIQGLKLDILFGEETVS